MGVTVVSTGWSTLYLVIIIALCHWSTKTVSGVLETTPAAVNRRLITCTGQPISLTCTHTNTGTGRTTWRFSPPIDCSRSFSHDQLPDVIDDCGPFSFESVTQLTTGVTQLSSTAVATVNSQHTGTLVECSDRSSVSMTNIGNVSLCIIGEPTISQAVNTRDGVKITWSLGCANNVNYTVIVIRQGDDNVTFSSVVTDSTSVVADNLTDGQDYTVYVTASIDSCNTPTAQRNFTVDKSDVRCVEPVPPVNGDVDYTLGVVGSSVTVQCNIGFVPQEPVTATCQANGSWSPIPAEHMCYECNTCNQLVLSTIFSSVFCSVVFFVLGGVAGMLCLYCFLRHKQSHAQDVAVQPPVPVYDLPQGPGCEKDENIQFKQNVCYESRFTS